MATLRHLLLNTRRNRSSLYAQTHEDVLLWRALHNVQHGFYIDIGAHDPTALSVTRAFYEHGWRGINVEPDPQYA